MDSNQDALHIRELDLIETNRNRFKSNNNSKADMSPSAPSTPHTPTVQMLMVITSDDGQIQESTNTLAKSKDKVAHEQEQSNGKKKSNNNINNSNLENETENSNTVDPVVKDQDEAHRDNEEMGSPKTPIFTV